MNLTRAWFASAIVLGLTGCAASGGDSSGNTSGSSCNVGDCVQRCVCQTGNQQQCVNACASAGGSGQGGSSAGGSGFGGSSFGGSGTGGSGFGGSGNTGVGGTTSFGGTTGGFGGSTGGTLSGSGGTTSGAGGSGGLVTLVHCDQQGETSAAPITQPCGDITSPTGTNVPLGPFGASMDVNVGTGFENTNPNDDATCPGFVGLFTGEPTSLTSQLLDTGPQPCTTTVPNTGNCLNYTLYSVYRPANWPSGPIPVLSWGNGTCAQPEGYGVLLRYIASYGFFVVAANSREVGSGTEIKHALDFAAAANQDPSSPYYGHLDMSRVGVMGHSQGSTGANAASSDSRVQSVILFNLGDTAPKPYLAISGDLDITGYTASAMSTAINGQPKAAYLYYHNPAGASTDTLRGHLVLMLSPQRVVNAATGWWQMMLENDTTARGLFVGTTCGLCGHDTDYNYGEHGL